MTHYTYKYADGLYDIEFWRGNERYYLCLEYNEYLEFCKDPLKSVFGVCSRLFA